MSERELEVMEHLINMLGGAGEGAFWIALAWIGQGYFSPLIGAFVFFVMLYMVYRFATRIVLQSVFHWNTLRRAAGCEMPHGEVTSGEFNRVLHLVEKGRAAEKEEESRDGA